MKRLFILALTIMSFLFVSCNKDEASKTYSTANMVRCYLLVSQYTQLFNTMGSYGEFATIRPLKYEGKMQMCSNIGTTEYPMTADMRGFQFGLGGLIVGVNYYGEYMAFDLACPNCSRADRRLSIGNAGIAKCAKCSLSYDLNNYGVISAASSVSKDKSPRGLFRYRISYDGTNLAVYN